MSERAKEKMEMAIWNHGRKKAELTLCINKLKRTTVGNHPAILEAIKVLEEERKRLKQQNIF